MLKKTIFITGATGVMGFETLKQFAEKLDVFDIRLLVRPTKRNKKKLSKYLKYPEITVVWGDLMNADDVKKGLGNAEYVLHIGGMVSPMADHFPEKTLEVNVGGMQNIIDAVKIRDDRDNIKVVYIGSVAQTSNRMPPYHWGRIGDPILPAKFDYYGLSKIKAERLLAESGLKRWVSLRQTGILHKGLIFKGSDPISFHVPLAGVLEWVSVEDSARLMVGVCDESLTKDSFWNNFYNIGGGKEFRLTNYEFEYKLMKSLGCPPPEKVFERKWFATQNFHGQWYEDSDDLNKIVPFRENITSDDYFKRLASQMPFWTKLAPLAPAFLVKWGMKRVALSKDLGVLDWLKRNDCEDRIQAFFGSREQQANIKGWSDFDPTPPSNTPVRLDHGYDETKPDSELDLLDMEDAAKFRGGKCLSKEMKTGDVETALKWECSLGHRFFGSPRLIIKGGHWCPDCAEKWNHDEQASKSPFLRQIFGGTQGK